MNRAALIELVKGGEEVDYLFFWGHRQKHDGQVDASCLSQWFPARFEVDGEAFATAEHFMMAGKARLFGDDEIRARILASTDPSEAKALGRKVRGFDGDAWASARFGIVVEGNAAKFGAQPRLRTFLLDTGDRVLVEASPRDRIWGIGLRRDDEAARDPERWRGQNLLGFALMEARERLRGG